MAELHENTPVRTHKRVNSTRTSAGALCLTELDRETLPVADRLGYDGCLWSATAINLADCRTLLSANSLFCSHLRVIYVI